MEDDKEITETDKEMFTNWSQSTLCLEYTKTALHKWVIQKWKQLLKDYSDSTMRQFLMDLNYAIPNKQSTNSSNRWSMQCSDRECDGILSKLLDQERKPGCLVLNDELKEHIQRLAQAQGDTLSEDTYIWCLANMFMQPRKGPKAIITYGPEDTDVSLFFKMIKDCKLFEFDGCDELYENILEVRKEIHHSATYLFTKVQTRNCLKKMTKLLKAIPSEKDCSAAISKIKRIKVKTKIMASISETEFQELTKDALKLQEKSLVADMEIDKVKGYTTDEKEQKLKDTQEGSKNIDEQFPSYGLKSRKELMKETQECKEKVKAMEDIKETMDKLKLKTLELKTKMRQIEDFNTPDTDLCDLLVKRVQRMKAADAKRCLIDIAATIKKYDLQ